MANKIVVLDPGHGGKDPGASGNGIQEKDIVLKIALATKQYLDNNFEGVDVRLTRTKDVFIELIDRSKMANNLKASLFVSIHINANPSPSGNGFEVYKYDKSTSQLTAKAQDMLHAMITKHAPYFQDRGNKQANFSVLRNSNMAAVLTESGFITNKADADILKDNNKLNNIAKGHGEGIATFLGLKRKTNTPSKPEVAPSTPKSIYKVVVGTYETLDEAKAIQNTLETQFRNVSITQEKA
jgi:N-acetylmuramoyl-L-alanine amidase